VTRAAILAVVVVAAAAGGWTWWRTTARVATSASTAPPGPMPAEAQQLLEEGRQAFDARRFSVSVTKLEEAAARWPHRLEIQFRLGRAYWGQDRPYPISIEKAIDAFGRAVALDVSGADPLGLEALRQFALANVRHERLADARRAYEQLVARETDPELVDYAQGQIEEIDLDVGVFVPPPDAVFNAKGQVLWPVGPGRMRTNQFFEKGRHTLDPVKEEQYYRLAIQADPTMHQGYNNLGVALMHQGRCAEAIPVFQEAQRVWAVSNASAGPYYPEANTWLLRCYVDLGDVDRALEQWKIVNAIPQRDNWSVLQWLRLKILTGLAAEAIPVLEQGADDDPEHVEVLQALASAYAAVGRHADAAAMMDRALSAIPHGHAFFHHLLDPWRAQRDEWRQAAGGGVP
jgi:tetratricopeptide (TPR) repeat protein